MVLPTMELGGRTCVWFTKSQAWLRNMTQGVGSKKSTHGGAIVNLVNECAETFRKASSGSEPKQAGLTPAQGSEAPMAAGPEVNTGSGAGEQELVPTKGKAAILSESESGEEEDRPRTKQPRFSRRLRAKRGEFFTLDVRGKPMTYTLMTGPRIVVPIDGPWIQHVVDDLLPRAGEQEKAVGQASSQGRPKDLLHLMDHGRIFWRDSSVSSDPGWTIVVQDDDGKKRFRRAGLSVPRRGLSGDTLSGEGFLQNARLVLEKARKKWNNEDMSGRDRIQV